MRQLFGVFCVVAMFFFALTSHAQVSTGTISGTVTDSTGAVLPTAEVVVLNEDTGISRTVQAGGAGRYSAPSLALGNYRVTASLAGFQTGVRSGINLTVGRTAVVNFELSVGAITQTVEVIGEAPLVDTVKGSMGELIESATITELPLNGRDLAQLVTLQTGAVHYTAGRQEGEGGKLLVVSGARPTANVFLMDGIAIEDFRGKTPSGNSGNFLGVDSVQEFKVEKNAYSAEFGRGGGGTFNIVTKSGTNTYHGTVFEFLRNDNLDAATWEANAFDAEKPEFKRNQFGASFGGPIISDRTFFFGVYEGLRERLGQTIVSDTFSSEIRTDPGAFGSPDIDPVIAPYLPLWPLPNTGTTRSDGTGQFAFNFSQPTNEDFYQLRIDHVIGNNDSIFGRYTHLDSDRLIVDDFPGFREARTVRNQYFSLEEKHIFSPTLLNSVRVGYTRSDPFDLTEQDSVDPSLFFVPGVTTLGDLSVDGVGGLGAGVSADRRVTNSYQFGDDAIYSTGRNSIKFGFSWNRIQGHSFQAARDAGNYRFGDIDDFFINLPNRFRGTISKGFNDPTRSFFQNIIAFYVQDDIQIMPRLTLNLGVRYEHAGVISEKYDRVANIRGDIDFIHQFTFDDLTLGNPWYENPSKKNFAPRIGFAWDIFGDGSTALRGGFGLFFMPIDTTWTRTMGFRMPPFLVETQLTDFDEDVPLFPNLAAICGPEDPFNPANPICKGRPAVNFIPFNVKTPYMMQYNLNVQKQIMPNTVLTIGYAGSRGIRLPAIADLNVPRASEIGGRLVHTERNRPNRNWDDLRLRYAGTNSWYNSLQIGVNKKFSQGLQFRGSYTFSKSLDEISGSQSASDSSAGPNFIPYYYDRTLYRSRSSFDATNVFSFSGTYELPFGRGLSGAAEKFIAGWQLGGILSLSNGFPGTVEIQRRRDMSRRGVRADFPDLVAGASNSPVNPDNPNQYYDPAAFELPPDNTLGNLGRNTLIMPGLATLDFTFTKNTAVAESANLQFRFEAFNFFNRPNFGIPALEVMRRNGRVRGDAGEITDTKTTGRQIQFGLKLIF
ncbi:MAG: TonB-dependent receptor [Acidobacteria bacterium]|nr:TonB-dependent receptor [Acidobacteriota bacterium]